MKNSLEKRNASEGMIGMGVCGAGKGGGTAGVLAAAVAGIVPVVVTRAVGEGHQAEGGEVIEIPSDKSGAAVEAKLEIDGEVGAVAVVSEEEAGGMSLTAEQCVAIAQLTCGRSKIEAARAAGVSRMTLYRWLNHDPGFKAAFNVWQEDVVSTTRGQMVATMKDAMRTVIKAIRGGDAKLAWKLLESQGVTEGAAAGSADVEEVKREQEMERRKKELEKQKERKRLEDDELMNGWG